MENKKTSGRHIFTIVFLGILLLYSVINIFQGRKGLRSELATFDLEGASEDIVELNTLMEDNILYKYFFVEGYGWVQNVLHKHEENSFDNVIDKEGYLHAGTFWNGFGDNPKELAMRVRRFSDVLERKGIRIGFVLCPSKTVRDEERYYGIPYEDFSKESDDMFRWLRYYGIPYLDLRNTMEKSGLTYEKIWFKTDVNWTPRAAFEGYRALVTWMNTEFDANLDPEEITRNIENYEILHFPKSMLGSQGRETGLVFSGGMEDYIALVPQTQGNYTWIDNDGGEKTGNFRETFLNEDIEGMDPYHLNADSFYLGELTAYNRLINLNPPNKKKVLLLRDSFASPVGTFLIQNCEMVDMVWNSRCSQEEIMNYLEGNEYDFVVVMLYPQNLSYSNFPFYPTKESEDA